MKSAATLAREAAGFSPEQAAKKARICVPYLKQIERRGGACYALARRLSALYNCRMELFLYGQTPTQGTEGRPQNTSTRSATLPRPPA